MPAFLLAIPAIAWVWKNIQLMLIVSAVVVVSNAIVGIGAFIKGYNSAALKCQVATLVRERNELKRDLGVQKDTSKYLQTEVARLSSIQSQRDQEDANRTANIKPIDGCVVPSGRVRNPRTK